MKENLIEFVKNYCNHLPKHSSLWLGLSGGADSIALAHLLFEAQISFNAVHFNHHLRETAQRDADFCDAFCKSRKISFDSIDLHIKQNQLKSETVESCARRLRQEWYQQHCAQNSIVLLAHHIGDVQENFIIRAMRGSSSSGLSGLRQVSTINQIEYHRPLLNRPKKSLTDYLRSKEIDWVEDETNQQDTYTRNVIRNKILPELAKTASLDGLSRSAENIQVDALFIESCARQWLLDNDMTAQNFSDTDPALQPRILRYFIFQQTGNDFIPGHTALERLTKEINAAHDAPIDIPLGNKMIIRLTPQGGLFIPAVPYQLSWNWRENNKLTLPGGYQLTVIENSTDGESFAANSLAPTLIVRTWKNGDRMIPFGRKNAQKIKDLFADKKIPHQKRISLPLLISQNDIIWIPDVRRAEFGRCIDKDTTVSFFYERL